METHLRLAERRGVLQGANISVVQEWANEVLYLLDSKEKIEDQVMGYRLSLAATHPQFAYQVFPEWQASKVNETYTGEEDVQLPEGEVWGTPGSDEENERLENLINASMQRVSTNDLARGGRGGG